MIIILEFDSRVLNIEEEKVQIQKFTEKLLDMTLFQNNATKLRIFFMESYQRT